jgi:hypothetical protein
MKLKGPEKSPLLITIAEAGRQQVEFREDK